MLNEAPTGGQAAPASPGAQKASGSFTPDPVPTVARGIDATVGRALERMATHATGPVEFPANPWRAAEPLSGCTGVRGVGICICCDRLYQAGHQIAPEAKRGPLGVYGCRNEVVDGVHVGSVPREQGVAQAFGLGGVVTATPASEGVSNGL